MARTIVTKILDGCPVCGSNTHEITWADNHGMEMSLETHCNTCGWCISAEGELRNPGRIINESIRQPNISESPYFKKES